jgi:integrase
MGRKPGSRNVGYFFRANRGWYVKHDGRFIALIGDDGEPLRSKATPVAAIKAARDRIIAAPAEPVNSVTVAEVCDAYLAKVKADGADATFKARGDTLFDFCHGLPPRFRGKTAKPSDYIHKGFGNLATTQLRKIDVDRWLQAHPAWKGSRRTRIQALKRAINYGVEAQLIPSNPIKGYKTPKTIARVTYLTPDQEKALRDAANPDMALAIQVCIRTGARPGCEFAKLTAKHVKDHGSRMEWVFQVGESKTKKLRTIRIADPEIIAIVRERIASDPKGRVFRNTKGDNWTRTNLSEGFRRLIAKLGKQGVEFDDDVCIYSCRHTYAKRVLSGFWTGKTTNIETLAELMGNSPQVCRDHYLQWCEHFSEPLWESA